VLSEIPANAAASAYVAPRDTATNATRTTEYGTRTLATRHPHHRRCRDHHLKPTGRQPDTSRMFVAEAGDEGVAHDAGVAGAVRGLALGRDAAAADLLGGA